MEQIEEIKYHAEMEDGEGINHREEMEDTGTRSHVEHGGNIRNKGYKRQR